MRREYDFSKAERGKFFKKGAELRLPIYLDPKVQRQIEGIAERKGKPISDVVNDVLKKDLELVDDLV
jgi:hypothetical protein